MLTKTTNIHKKSSKIVFSKIQNTSELMDQAKNNYLKNMCALGSEIIATRTDDVRRMADGRPTNFLFHELC